MENKIRQGLKMEAVGKLAGGIAHDFNNILTVIHGHTELALMKSGSNDPLRKYLTDILKSSKRANDLITQLLAFSRKQIIEPSLIDINEVISNLNKMLQRLIREDIQIRIELFPDLPLIKADSGQIEQIFMNLVINARDSIDEKDEPQSEKIITLETDITMLDDHFVKLHPGSKPGGHVVISVSDTGRGMTEEVKEHIFEPFYTTKPSGKGIGLGLSTIYGIVKQNNGSIYVYSESGKGTTFKIYWPYSDDQSTPRITASRNEEFPAGQEIILVVEDNPNVRYFICDTLDTFGYTTHEASNGKEALEMVGDRGLKIDLLITDVVMPEMGGTEVAEKIKKLAPEVKILFTSGYTSNHIVHNGILEEGVNFIQKPFSIQDVLGKVRQVLDGEDIQTDSK
jgi:nitrogen-specific signal transduction histidine kinase/ActR/RegA family two-component response regulator